VTDPPIDRESRPVVRHKTAGLVRRRVRWGLGAVVTLFVVWILIVAPGLTLGANSVQKWTAPYTGTVKKSDTPKTAGCAGTTGGDLPFSLATGKLTGKGVVSATSCNGTASVSSAELNALGRVTLPKFTNESGKVTVTVRWALDFVVKGSLSGSPCGSAVSALNYSSATVTLAAGVLNESTAKILVSKDESWGGNPRYVVGSNETDVHLDLSLKMTVLLDGTYDYSILTGIGFILEVEAINPSPGFPVACTAAASVEPGTGTVLGTLLYAQVG